jgi:predicted nucleic acid-binding protein
MNGTKYLLDTNSIIYAIKYNYKLPLYEYLISVITEIELFSYAKLSKQDEKILEKILSNFKNIALIDNIKNETIRIRKNNNLKLPDSLIVATAIIENAILVTSDKQLLNSNIINTIEIKDLIDE